MSDLAIIIPAYKIDYFSYTLKSLSSQSCKNFTVYVGDDCSSDNFKDLIEEYKYKIDIIYYRFADNKGSVDLVSQWRRCIELSQNEHWIWLFSDDDIIGENCVELFYKELLFSRNCFDLYHFNVKVINSVNNIIRTPESYPMVLSNKQFYQMKATAKIDSFVVEYIFSREVYEKFDGFEKFDLAWGSDIATWIKMGSRNIKTIQGGYVYWRQSDKNITPNHQNEMVFRKLNIDVDFLSWVNTFFRTINMIRFNRYIFFRLLFYYSLILDSKQANQIIAKAVNKNVIDLQLYYCLKYTYPLISFLKQIKIKIYDNSK